MGKVGKMAQKSAFLRKMQGWADISREEILDGASPPSAEGVQKKPAGAEESGISKKPAAANASGINKRPASADAETESDRKDRNKDGYFERNRSSLDAATLDMVDAMNTRDKRSFINTLVSRDDNSGKWPFNFDQCEIIATQDRYNDDYNKQNQMSIPFGRARTMWGGNDLLQQAISDGEAKVVVKSGVRFVEWSESKQTLKKGAKDILQGQGKKTSTSRCPSR